MESGRYAELCNLGLDARKCGNTIPRILETRMAYIRAAGIWPLALAWSERNSGVY